MPTRTPKPANRWLDRWLRRWPAIPRGWTHDFGPRLVARIPTPLAELLGHDQLSVELPCPIHWARGHDCPFAEQRPAFATLYQCGGRERLIWGSDMPSLERNGTSRRSRVSLMRLAEGSRPGGHPNRSPGSNVLRLFGSLGR